MSARISKGTDCTFNEEVQFKSRVIHSILRNATPTRILKRRLLLDKERKKEYVDIIIETILGSRETKPEAEEIMFLISPAKKHNMKFKLHIFNKSTKEHLCMFTITNKEMLHIGSHYMYQDYSIATISRLLDLKTLYDTPSLMCFLMHNGCSMNCTPITPELFKELIEKINTNKGPIKEDIDNFFSWAEISKHKLIIRPQMLFSPLNAFDEKNADDIKSVTNFNVDCYRDEKFLGTIALSSDIIRQQLSNHKGLLDSTSIITDPSELTKYREPLRYLSIVCRWLRIDMVYDLVSDIVYNMSKEMYDSKY